MAFLFYAQIVHCVQSPTWTDLTLRASVALFLLMRQFTQDGWQRKTVCRTTHKTVLFFTVTRSVVVTERQVCVHFQTRWAPSYKTIHKLCNQFNDDGSLLERKRRRPSSVHSPENIDAVRVALQRSPSKSTKKAAGQLGIFRRSVQWALKSDLNLYPYKITVLPKITVHNKHQRMAFAGWVQNNEVSFNSVWFSDEAHFRLDSVVDKVHAWFMRRCIRHRELQWGSPSQVMDC
jgi:hypothetical protein